MGTNHSLSAGQRIPGTNQRYGSGEYASIEYYREKLVVALEGLDKDLSARTYLEGWLHHGMGTSGMAGWYFRK